MGRVISWRERDGGKKGYRRLIPTTMLLPHLKDGEEDQKSTWK